MKPHYLRSRLYCGWMVGVLLALGTSACEYTEVPHAYSVESAPQEVVFTPAVPEKRFRFRVTSDGDGFSLAAWVGLDRTTGLDLGLAVIDGSATRIALSSLDTEWLRASIATDCQDRVPCLTDFELTMTATSLVSGVAKGALIVELHPTRYYTEEWYLAIEPL